MEQVDLSALLNQVTRNEINKVFTAMPCVITGGIDLKAQRVNVRPLINRVTTDGESREHPVIQAVPIIFPGSKSSQFSFPVAVGDTVLCVFSQRSVARFKLGSDTPTTPMDFGKYSKNDAMAIPGLFTFPAARNNPNHRTWEHSTEDAVLAHNIGSGNEVEVRLKKSGDIIINTPGKAEVNCETSVVNANSSADINTQTATINASSETNINSPTTNISGNVTIGGSLTVSGASSLASATINGIGFSSHTHQGDDGGSTGPAR